MLASTPDQSHRPKPDTPCPHCGTAWPSCDTLHWLRATTCCPKCRGSHEGDVDATS